MGAFKPLLPFGGGTVLEACVGSLRGAGVSEIVVVVGHRGEEIKAALAGEKGVRFASNDEAESEMSVSIARGAEALGDEVAGAVLIALVDYPAVPSRAIRQLLDARMRTGARLIVPEWEGRGGHPVLIDLAFREELLRLDAQGGLRALFDAHRGEVLRVPVETPFVTRDMDTWENYCALHRDVFGSAPEASESARR
jgi:CTP:molybdopterin cytidylyltransferase MocA